MKRKKILSFLVLSIILTSIVLSGCGDKKNQEDGGNKTSDNSSTNITSGGSVTVGITQDLDSLDPHKMVYAGTREVLFNVFEGLVKPNTQGELVPAVASDYKISDDATVYTFTLRDGIKFHDGNPVTVEDVKYSIERYAGIQGKESAFSILKEVKIVDNKTIEVRLSEGNLEFLSELTLAIIPKSNANPGTTPIGTGPFKFKSFTAGQSFVVEKFNDYWNTGKPYLDQVTFKIISNTDTAFTELQAGTLDVLQYLTADQAKAIESSNFNVLQGNVNYVQGLFLNNKYGPFQNQKVRQALYYAIDRDAINQFVLNGKSHVIGTSMIPSLKKYYDATTETKYKPDVTKAKELLKEAGYENGFDLTITVPNNYTPHMTVAQVVIENLKQIGINAKIEQVEFTTWYSEVYSKRNYQSTVVAVDGKLAPSSWFEKNFSTNANNFTNYTNPTFDDIFKKAKSTVKDDEKISYYKQLQNILADDAASIYIEDPANLVAVNKKLTGYSFYPVAAQDMSTVGLKAQ